MNIMGTKTNFEEVKSLYSRVSRASIVDYIDFSKFKNLENIQNASSKVIELENLNKLKTATVTAPVFASKIVIKNNLNLLNLNYAEYTTTPISVFDISNLPSLSSLKLENNSISEFNLFFPNLAALDSLSLISATNINLLSSYPFIKKWFWGAVPSLTSLNYSPLTEVEENNLADRTLSLFNKSLSSYTSYVNNSLLDYKNTSVGNNFNFCRRTSASDEAFFNLLPKTQISPLELDAKYPIVETSPNSYTPSTYNSYTVYCPISTNGNLTNIQISRHLELSGNYIKTHLIKDQRDVFSNSNDYHILFNRLLRAWTVVGPTSGSNTIWLSAQEGIGDWGNPPSVGWYGPASIYSVEGYYSPSNPGPGVSLWWHYTSVSPTNTNLFNDMTIGTELGGSYLRLCYNPFSGYNPNFFKPELNFSGILHIQGSTSPGTSTRGYMISPYHYIASTHFGFPSQWSKYGLDGTIQTASVLGTIDVGFDTYIGVLSQPLSGTSYRIGLGNFYNKVKTKQDFLKFLFGPTQNGRVGYSLMGQENPYVNPTITGYTPGGYHWTSVSKFSGWESIYTIPKSQWYGDYTVAGDSSSPFWYINSNELILLGHVAGSTFGGGTGSARYGEISRIFSINQAMSALQSQFHPSETFVYQLSTYNFDT